MSDVMFYGVLRMPYELAMSDHMSRMQFYNRAQEAANRVEAADKRIAELESANAGLLMANRDCMDHFSQIKADYDALLAAAPVAAQEPFGYFHELLDHEGKGNGVWLGAYRRDIMAQAYIEGETGKEIVALYKAQPAQGDLPDADPNAPWLSLAHLICADAGIPPGHITARLEALRDKLDGTAQGERVAVCPTLDRECGEYYGGWCTTCPKARTKAQGERQPFGPHSATYTKTSPYITKN